MVLNHLAPSILQVLELLTKALKETGISEIVPDRSQAIPLALLEAPYRSFLNTNENNEASSTSLLVYCLPTSATEYTSFSSEAESIRSKILSSDSSTVVAFDVAKNSFVGGSVEDILSAVNGSSDKKSELSAACLTALSDLDK